MVCDQIHYPNNYLDSFPYTEHLDHYIEVFSSGSLLGWPGSPAAQSATRSGAAVSAEGFLILGAGLLLVKSFS